MKKIYILFFIITFVILSSCSNRNTENSQLEEKVIYTPEYLYAEAIIEFNKENYDFAKKKFEEIQFKYPLSNEAIQSQIMLAFLEYVKLNYDESIFKFTRIINNYPSHKNIDYIYYMRALCYYEQIEDQTLDGDKSLKALNSFNQILNRFPNSKYSKDSRQKIIFIKEIIAAKNMDIGMFYLKNKKYNAAMNRFKTIIEHHTTSKFIPEALYRLVEIYYNLGLVEEAKKTASVIGFNYPNSDWYKYAYKILNKENATRRDTLIKKLSNILNINEKTN